MKSKRAKYIALDPVFPNAGVQAWYQRQLDRLINESSRGLIPKLAKIWKGEPSLFASDEISVKALQSFMSEWGRSMQKRFDESAEKIAKDFATKNQQATQTGMMSSLKKAGFAIKFKPSLKSIEAFRLVVGENVGLIKSIPKKYLLDIEQQVFNAVRNGSDLYTLSKNLRKSHGITVRRAALIARDQNAKGKAVIERVRQMELGFTRGIWMHSHAGKEPRPTHVAMNGKPYLLRKGMYDKAVREWVHPGQLINCRCVSRPILEGFDDI